MRGVLAAIVLAIGATAVAPVAQSQAVSSVPQAAVLTIDSDTMFNQSLFGQRVAQDLAADESLLLAENRRIQAELTAEEKALTEQRSKMDAKAFRAIAEAFDARVVRIRNEQDQKAAGLEQRRQREQEAFARAAGPILTDMMREAGASVVIERGSALLSDPAVDVTALAIQRLNATLGDGLGTTPDTPDED